MMKRIKIAAVLFGVLALCYYASVWARAQAIGVPPVGGPQAPVIMGTQAFTPPSSSIAVQATGNVNSYWQMMMQNTACGSSASTDFVVTSSDGDDSHHYADFGINSACGGAAPFTSPHAAYLYTTDNELDLSAQGASGIINLISNAGVSVSGVLNVGSFASPTSTYVCQSAGVLSTCQNLISSFTNDLNYLTSALAASTYLAKPAGTTAQYLRGDGTAATFPAIVTYAYEGTNKRTNSFPYFNSGTVASGVVAFNLTVDGTAGGTAIFPNGVIQSSVQAFCNDSTNPYSYGAVFSNANKTVTITVNKAQQSFLSLLGLNVLTAPAAANGSVCNIQVYGY